MTKTMTSLDFIFQEWTASLGQQRSLAKDSVESNFAELFSDMQAAGATFEEAHSFLNKAIKAHSPNQSIMKTIWQKNKAYYDSFDDFQERWLKSINNKATAMFFEHFPRPQSEDEKRRKAEAKQPPKKFGPLTEKEHREYQDYVGQFTPFTTEEIEELRRKREAAYKNNQNN